MKGSFSILSPHNQTLVCSSGLIWAPRISKIFSGWIIEPVLGPVSLNLESCLPAAPWTYHPGRITRCSPPGPSQRAHNERHSVLHIGGHWQEDVRMRNVASKSTSQVPSVVLVEQNTCHCRFVSYCCKWQLLHSEMTTWADGLKPSSIEKELRMKMS